MRKRLEEADANRDEIAISVVTLYEVLRGGLGTRHERLIREFMARLVLVTNNRRESSRLRGSQRRIGWKSGAIGIVSKYLES